MSAAEHQNGRGTGDAKSFTRGCPMTTQELSLDRRREILQREISKYVKKGFRVASQTDTTAQLIKPKKFSLLIAIIGLLFFIVGLLVYLVWYASRKDLLVYLSVDPAGKVSVSKNTSMGFIGTKAH